MGWMKEDGARQAQMMAIAWIVLQLPTNNRHRPGAIYNYASDSDINVRLTVNENGVTANVDGRDIAQE
jgi:hypothetical protein